MPSTLASLLRDLALAFPEKHPPPETIKLYARELADIPDSLLAAAVREMIRTGEFFPRISAIRAAAAERALDLPSEAEALAQIEDVTAHPLVGDALRKVGGWSAWKQSQEPDILRSQFLKLYREMRAAALKALVVDGFREQIEP